MELQTFDDGTVAKILAEQGQSVEVGGLIAVLAEEGEDLDEAAQAVEAKAGGEKKQNAQQGEKGKTQEKQQAKDQAAQKSQQEQVEPGQAEAAQKQSRQQQQHGADAAVPEPRQRGNGHSSDGRVLASPLARKIAEDEGVDLSRLEGSGPGGRIVRRDVETAMKEGPAPAREAPPSAPPSAPQPETGPALEHQVVPLSDMRRTIARRLVESKTTIPHYQVTVVANMDPLLALRKQLNDQLEAQCVKLSVNDFIVRACALAMHQHPFVNSRWKDEGEGGSIEILGDVNVAVAVALPGEQGGGLVVATLRNTNRMGLRQISQETKRLAEKARSRGLTLEEMSDSTFTVSNLGMFGVTDFTAIINPPNSAILAIGGAEEKPVVRDGEIVVGREMAMTMSSDHRIVDGAMAAQYLGSVKEMLENPATLLV